MGDGGKSWKQKKYVYFGAVFRRFSGFHGDGINKTFSSTFADRARPFFAGMFSISQVV